MSEKKYDLVVIGAGPGGYVASIVAAQKGMKVANIEKRETLGGTCLNVGCIPSKALLHASEQYENNVKNNANLSWGIKTSDVSIDVQQLMKKKSTIVDELTKGINFLFNKNKIDKYVGEATLVNKNEIQINGKGKTEKIFAEKIIIATGSEPSNLNNIKIDEQKIVTSTGALDLKSVPKKVIVIGAGVIGLELGTVWRRLGSEVEVIEFLPRVLNGMDSEVSEKFHKILLQQGLKFKLEHSVEKTSLIKDKVHVEIKDIKTSKTDILEADIVLVAVGRRPNTDNLGLEKIGVKVDKRGFVETDDKFKTSVDNIYAIGDVIKGPMLAHKAEEEGIAVAEYLAGKYGHVNYDVIPGVVYTSPEVAYVGKTEEELKLKKISYNVGKFPFLANSRAKINDEADGFVKILADKTTDKILGVHMIGPDVGNMIAEMALAMEFGASAEDVARTCHAHPTLTEAIKEAALAVDKRPIHF